MMMRTCLLVVLLTTAATQVSALSYCESAPTADACYRLAMTSYNCVWLRGACTFDPCTLHQNQTVCLQAEHADNCLPTPWLNNQLGTGACISYELLCNRIPVKECRTQAMCAVKSSTYCGYAIPKGTGGQGVATAVCTTFPLWSIALLVLWLFIMIILIAIIVLALKRKQSAITTVESGGVDVDQVAIRDDNFAPMVHNAY